MNGAEPYKELGLRELKAIRRMCKSEEIDTGNFETLTVGRIQDRVEEAMEERGIRYD